MKRPLRIAALAVVAVSVAAAAWLYFGGPGLSSDPYYSAAQVRQGLPFAAATVGVALLVFLAAATARSRGRWASSGLWLALIGAFVVSASIFGEFAIPAAHPHGYPEYGEPYLNQILLLGLLGMAGALSLIVGGVLWLLSYRLDRARNAG